MTDVLTRRRLAYGAEPLPGGGVHFRIWAPIRRSVEVVLEPAGEAHPLEAEGEGWYSGLVPGIGPGADYRYRLDGEAAFPDPASRHQPEGPHGPSRVVDPSSFPWTDGDWPGVSMPGQVFYELHLGTFTAEGTWASAGRELPYLRDLGVTIVEVMPVAEFSGRFGWGYDGVDFFAPSRLYGEPDAMRRFVDRAHALGLGVVLDVVYNHFGPDGNYLEQYAPAFFTDRRECEWGRAIDFDGEDSGPVREFFLANAEHWISEYHLDGLRLDATQQIFDDSEDHILAALGRRAREAAGRRSIVIVAENEPQEGRLARPLEAGGYGLDGLWNDDLHHAARVAVTGRAEAYFRDYAGSPQELVSAARRGFLYQGQWYSWQGARRGEPGLDLPPETFVNYLQNHDQVANQGFGRRLHQLTSPSRLRALTAYLLLGPGTPLLFQGQEFAASSPFQFFADHDSPLADAVRRGRKEFLLQFPHLGLPEIQEWLPDPCDPETPARCRLDPADRERNAEFLRLHRDLLRLRREDETFRLQGARGFDGAVLGREAFVLRWFGFEGADRLLLVNLGHDQRLRFASEPLLAPPRGRDWRTLWTSEDPRYGGTGSLPVEAEEPWRMRGQISVALAAERPGAGED